MAQPTESGCLVDTDFRPPEGPRSTADSEHSAKDAGNIIDSNDIMLTRNSFSSRPRKCLLVLESIVHPL
jgi:hypothetical protein